MYSRSIVLSLVPLFALLVLVTLANPAAGGYLNDLPLAKRALAGQLSERQQEVFAAQTRAFLNVKKEYEGLLDTYMEIAENSQPSEQLGDELFSKGIYLVQVALEYYAYLNDGPYPPNAGVLICGGLLEDFPYNPYTDMPMQLFGIGAIDRIEHGLVYVPEYVRADDEIQFIGYWLIVITPLTQEEPESLLKPLPGGIELPDNTWVVLESHRAD